MASESVGAETAWKSVTVTVVDEGVDFEPGQVVSFFDADGEETRALVLMRDGGRLTVAEAPSALAWLMGRSEQAWAMWAWIRMQVFLVRGR